MLIHWTHQNGTSVDFMVPKKREDDETPLSNHAGMLIIFFNSTRKDSSPSTERRTIDFESMAKHILALDDAAQTKWTAHPQDSLQYKYA